MIEDFISIKEEIRGIDFNKARKFIILEFTKELIKNYSPEEILRLKDTLELERKLKQKTEKTKSKVKEIIQSKEEEIKKITKDMIPSVIEGKNLFFSGPTEKKEPFEGIPELKNIREGMPRADAFERSRMQNINPFRELKLIIPETRFPPHLEYIKPIPMNKEIDLGKLNALLNDSFVNSIECYGENQNLFVKGNFGTKKTGIILNKEEVNEIIKKFSEETKIPAQEGIFRVVVGKIIFMAIISDVVGSKFIIRKMPRELPPPSRF